MKTSDQINELADALSKAQGEIKGAMKDALNPHFKSKYADIASVMDAIRDPMSKHGLSIVQFPENDPDNVVDMLTTRLMHKSGQWMEASAALTIEKPTMQAMGSAITYMRRYALSAILGVAQEDDDGNSASGFPKVAPNPASIAGRKEAFVTPVKDAVVTDKHIEELFASIQRAGWAINDVEVVCGYFFKHEDFARLTMTQYDKILGLVSKHTFEEAQQMMVEHEKKRKEKK